MNLQQTFNNLIEKLAGWIDALVLLLPNFVAAVLIVIVAVFAARFAQKGVTRLMKRVSAYPQVNRLLATAAYVAVLATGTFVALGVLGLDKAVTSLLAGAGVVGLALAFAFQDIAANFISGILLAVRRPFRVGDLVETNDFFGTVDGTDLRSTELKTLTGQLVLIPNKEVFQNPIVNYSRLGKRRVDLSCSVAYGDDLEKAERVAVEAVTALDYRDKDKDVEFFYETFGDSSINFVVRFWIDFEKQADFLAARSGAIKRLKHAFDEQGLTIPFPIRTLDFGVVGGVNLNEVLPQGLQGNGSPAQNT